MEFLEECLKMLQKLKMGNDLDVNNYSLLFDKKCRKSIKKFNKITKVLQRLYYLRSIRQILSAVIANDGDNRVRRVAMNHLLHTFDRHHELFSDFSELKKFSKVYSDIVNRANHRVYSDEFQGFVDKVSAFYQNFYRSLPELEMHISSKIFLEELSAFRYFLNAARKCPEEHLQSFFAFVNMSSIQKNQVESYNNVKKYYDSVAADFSKLDKVAYMKHSHVCDSIYKLTDCNVTLLKEMIDQIFAYRRKRPDEYCLLMWKSTQNATTISDEDLTVKNQEKQNIPCATVLSHLAKKKYHALTGKIKTALIRYSSETVEKMLHNYSNIPRNVLIAICQWQLKCYELMESSDKMSDFAPFVIYGHGAISEKQYFNYLETGSPSFLTVTNNIDLSNLINAIALTEVQFEELKHRTIFADNIKDVRTEGLVWNLQQKKLLQATLNLDVENEKTEQEFYKLVSTGSNVKGSFLFRPDILEPLKYHTLGTILAYKFNCKPGELYYRMLSAIEDQPREKYHCRSLKLRIAMDLKQFDDALMFCPDDIRDFPDKMFFWNNIIAGLIAIGKDPTTWSSEIASYVVDKLVTHVNISALKALLSLKTDYRPNKRLVMKAVSTGSEKLALMLINLCEIVDKDILECAVERRFNIVVFKFLDKDYLKDVLMCSVKSNNIEVAVYILEHENSFSMTKEALILAAKYNRIKICQHLLATFPELCRNHALITAVLEENWKLADILIECKANPKAQPHHRINSLKLTVAEVPIVTAYQLAISHGCLKFVRNYFIKDQLDTDLNCLALAAASGSVRMMDFFFRAGLRVIDDHLAFPVALEVRHVELCGAIARNIRLNIVDTGDPIIINWFNLLEQWKNYLYMNELITSPQNDMFLPELKKFLFRRALLYKKVDGRFYISSIFNASFDQREETCFSLASERKKILTTISEFQRNLLSLVPVQFEFHVFSSNSNHYAFFVFTVLINSISNAIKPISDIIFVDENKFSFRFIRDMIKVILVKSFQFEGYLCDFTEFKADVCVRYQEIYVNSINYMAELLPLNEFVPDHDGESLLNEIFNENRLQLAVASGDIESTRTLINKIGNSDHQDLWLDPTLFHKIVDYNENLLGRKEEMTSLILNAGLPCWRVNPKTVQSIIDYALSNGQTNLAEKVLEHDLPNDMAMNQKILRVLQYGSQKTFKMFLAANKLTESDIFKECTNALIELDTRCVPLEKELHTLLLYRLANYGFENFCADPLTSKVSSEWLNSLHLVIEWTESILRSIDCNLVLAVNNELLFRLKIIHNQIYLIKDKVHFKKLPLKEVMFLIAIFISSVKSDEFEIYRMVLNKQTICNILQAIAAELKSFSKEYSTASLEMENILSCGSRDRDTLENSWNNNASLPKLSDNVWNKLCSKKAVNLSNEKLVEEVFGNEAIDFKWKLHGKHKKMFKFTIRVYQRVRQMYSLNKILSILENFSLSNSSKEVIVASMKRFIQIFGESIKNTVNSQNLPAKFNKILSRQLSTYVELNKKTRDISCHDYPVAKKHFKTEDQCVYYRASLEYLDVVKVTISILLICTTFEFSRCLFGMLRSCKSLVNIQDMIRYVGDQRRFLPLQDRLLEITKKYHKDVESSLNVINLEVLSLTQKKAVEHLKVNHIRRIPVIEHLEGMISSMFSYKYHYLQTAAFLKTDIVTYHRMLDMNLNQSLNNYLTIIHDGWEIELNYLSLLPDSVKLQEKQTFILANLQMEFDINFKALQEYHCQKEVDRICQLFDSDDPVKKGQLYQKLQGTRGGGCFGNIFTIDAKIQAIKQVFQKKKTRGSKEDDRTETNLFENKLKELYEDDTQELSNIFKSIQSSMLRLLKEYNCDSIEKMAFNMEYLPIDAILALEYWMLEMSEILITTKQFQDNFHTIQKNVQMICGRNFRNYLAHDGISYDLLTNSSRVKVLINALVMATKNWKLFRMPQKKDLPALVNLKTEGISWIKSQKDLKQAVLALDLKTVNSVSNEQGGILSGIFWTTVGLYSGIQSVKLLELLQNKIFVDFDCLNFKLRSILTMLCPDAPGRWQEFASSKTKYINAMMNGDFQKAPSYLGLSWKELFKSVDSNFGINLFLGSFIRHLEESCEESVLLDVLKLFDPEVLIIGLAVGSDKKIDLMLKKFPFAIDFAQLHAISVQRNSVDHFNKLFPRNEIDFVHVNRAAICNNFVAFNYFLQNQIAKPNEELENTLVLCCKYGRNEMIKLLLENFPVLFNAIDRALRVAIVFCRWTTARLLVDRGADPWHKDSVDEESSADIVVKNGCYKMLKHFFKIMPRTTHGILRLVAEHGSKRMMELFLKKGFDICQDQHVLFCSCMNIKDTQMMAYVEDCIFSFPFNECLDSNLREWLKILHEIKIGTYFKSKELNLCLQHNQLLVGRIVNHLNLFNRIQIVGYNGDDLTYEDDIRKCVDLQATINKPTLKQSRKTVLLYQTNGNLIVSAECFLFDEENSCNSFEDEPIIVHNTTSFELSVDKICADVQKLISESRLKVIDCKLTYLSDSFRLLIAGSQRFIIEILPEDTRTSTAKSFLTDQNSKGETILHHLPSTITFDLFKLLLDHGADLSLLNNDGETALFSLLRRDISWDVLKDIFKFVVSTDINLLMIRNKMGSTLLFKAVSSRQSEVVQFLLEHGVDQTIPNHDCIFPLIEAVNIRSVPIVKILLADNPEVVNLRRMDRKTTALYAAASLNNAELVQLFLDAGADCTLRDAEGCTAVAAAIADDCLDSLKVLLEHGQRAGIDVLSNVTGTNFTALLHGMGKDNVDTFRAVLEFQVGGALDSNLSKESLARLKEILLKPFEENHRFTLLTSAYLSNSQRTIKYLKKVIKFYEEHANECLDIGAVQTSFGCPQKTLLSAFVTNSNGDEVMNFDRDPREVQDLINFVKDYKKNNPGCTTFTDQAH